MIIASGGLEADRIFLLNPDDMPLKWPHQQVWKLQQEHNIKYVALTRLRRTLSGALASSDECLRRMLDIGMYCRYGHPFALNASGWPGRNGVTWVGPGRTGSAWVGIIHGLRRYAYGRNPGICAKPPL